jgi:hypothetical protein
MSFFVSQNSLCVSHTMTRKAANSGKVFPLTQSIGPVQTPNIIRVVPKWTAKIRQK